MTAWVSLLVAALKLLSSLAAHLRDRNMITAAEAAVIADAMEKQAHEVDKGRAARLAQRARDAGGVPDDADSFRRD